MSSFVLEIGGAQALRELCREPTLFGFDFDGTLAPIVEQPMEARMAPSTARLLHELSRRAPVAVVSGRSVRDLACLLDGFQPAALVGNHGLEGTRPGARFRDEALRAVGRWKAQLPGLLGPALLASGVAIEDKTFSMTLHYRRTPAPEAARRAILDQFHAHGPLDPAPRVISGKDVFNLVPWGSPNKGDAMRDLMESLGVARSLFVGDDDTDEDVFALGDPRILGVRIEAGPAVPFRTKAPWLLRDQLEIDELLRVLLSCWEHPG